MIEEEPIKEKINPKYIVFGDKTPELICDFSKIEESEFDYAYDMAVSQFGNTTGSIGRYESLEEARKKQNKILSIYEWTGNDWVEKK